MAGAVALEAAREKLSARQLPIVAFHLGAQNRSRRLSVEWFVALAAALASFRPFQICLLGVKSERALSLKFLSLHERAGAKAPVVNLCGETSVQDLAGLLPLASLLVSADTGVAHVGASLGIPQIVVAMGPAFAHETGPYNPRALVLQGLAPCGPCLENKGCERKQCRAAPPPSLALPLALRALGWESDRTLPPEAARDPLLIGGYFTTWETRVDSWGYRLLPTEPLAAPWSEESLTAMVLRETALRHFRESRGGEIAFRSPEDLLAEKRLYRASPARRSRRAGAAERRAPEDSIFKSLRFITQRGVESPRRARFMEIAREILASLL
ncbi:MAG: glycosyltransferase family 9 protein [Deltaproteobacteria bacterium]|nr:glycosyltransferase family 9 protein [Deltaproteobacteria bacterium]